MSKRTLVFTYEIEQADETDFVVAIQTSWPNKPEYDEVWMRGGFETREAAEEFAKETINKLRLSLSGDQRH